MEDGRIIIPAVHPDKIRMDEAELVSLFNVVAPTLRAAKRRIYKLEILQPFTAEQRIPLKECGYWNRSILLGYTNCSDFLVPNCEEGLE